MNRKSARAVLFVVLFLIIAAGGLYSYFRWFRDEGTKPDFETILEVIDRDIGKGYYPEAVDTLSVFKKFSGNSTEWLRILRRAEAVGRALDDYSYLSEYAEAAVKDLPGNEELWALRVYGLMKEGKYAEAFSSGDKHLEEQRFQSLIAEAALHLGPDEVDSEKVEENEYWRMFMTGGERAPQTYEEYARKTQDDRIFAAAAIAWMIEGNATEAVENCTQIQNGDYDLLRVYIYYDAGKYPDALSILNSMQETGRIEEIEGYFLEADFLMALGRYEDAENVYERIIRDAPEESWIPYLNLVWIKTRRDEIEDAADYILRAFEIFPQKEEVGIALSLFLIQFGRSGGEEKLIEHMADTLEENDSLRPLVERSLNLSQSPEQYKAVLWQLFNAGGRNVKIAQFFAWYLLGLHDYENLQLVLEKSERKFGQMEWISFFYGTLYAVQGEVEKAEEHFEKAVETAPRWETWYNLALLYLHSGDSSQAYEYFGLAEGVLRRPEGILDPKAFAQIKVMIARIQMADEQHSTAKRTVLEALEYDPENLEGQLLKKQLEAGIKR